MNKMHTSLNVLKRVESPAVMMSCSSARTSFFRLFLTSPNKFRCFNKFTSFSSLALNLEKKTEEKSWNVIKPIIDEDKLKETSRNEARRSKQKITTLQETFRTIRQDIICLINKGYEVNRVFKNDISLHESLFLFTWKSISDSALAVLNESLLFSKFDENSAASSSYVTLVKRVWISSSLHLLQLLCETDISIKDKRNSEFPFKFLHAFIEVSKEYLSLLSCSNSTATESSFLNKHLSQPTSVYCAKSSCDHENSFHSFRSPLPFSTSEICTASYSLYKLGFMDRQLSLVVYTLLNLSPIKNSKQTRNKLLFQNLSSANLLLLSISFQQFRFLHTRHKFFVEILMRLIIKRRNEFIKQSNFVSAVLSICKMTVLNQSTAFKLQEIILNEMNELDVKQLCLVLHVFSFLKVLNESEFDDLMQKILSKFKYFEVKDMLVLFKGSLTAQITIKGEKISAFSVFLEKILPLKMKEMTISSKLNILTSLSRLHLMYEKKYLKILKSLNIKRIITNFCCLLLETDLIKCLHSMSSKQLLYLSNSISHIKSIKKMLSKSFFYDLHLHLYEHLCLPMYFLDDISVYHTSYFPEKGKVNDAHKNLLLQSNHKLALLEDSVYSLHDLSVIFRSFSFYCDFFFLVTSSAINNENTVRPSPFRKLFFDEHVSLEKPTCLQKEEESQESPVASFSYSSSRFSSSAFDNFDLKDLEKENFCNEILSSSLLIADHCKDKTKEENEPKILSLSFLSLLSYKLKKSILLNHKKLAFSKENSDQLDSFHEIFYSKLLSCNLLSCCRVISELTQIRKTYMQNQNDLHNLCNPSSENSSTSFLSVNFFCLQEMKNLLFFILHNQKQFKNNTLFRAILTLVSIGDIYMAELNLTDTFYNKASEENLNLVLCVGRLVESMLSFVRRKENEIEKLNEMYFRSFEEDASKKEEKREEPKLLCEKSFVDLNKSNCVRYFESKEFKINETELEEDTAETSIATEVKSSKCADKDMPMKNLSVLLVSLGYMESFLKLVDRQRAHASLEGEKCHEMQQKKHFYFDDSFRAIEGKLKYLRSISDNTSHFISNQIIQKCDTICSNDFDFLLIYENLWRNSSSIKKIFRQLVQHKNSLKDEETRCALSDFIFRIDLE